jgi:hypothetical protein
MASERKARKQASKASSGASEATKAVQQDRAARAAMPREGDPGVLPQGTQDTSIETVEANLLSTYGWGGRLYGPGERIMVPKGLADQLNVELPKSEAGFNPASRQIENREDSAHPAAGFNPPKEGAGLKEGRQR